jgi:putative iron-regulated protein
MRKVLFSLSVLALSLAATSCSDDDGGGTQQITRAEVIENYVNLVHANYSQAYWDAVELETAIAEFTAAPAEESFNTVKLKWKEARESYGTTEVFRFEGSPVENIYSQLNAWPMDENYIDYIDGDAAAGIINNPTGYPDLSKAVLLSLNQVGGEKNISVGYHAIEFLLWGQDLTPAIDNLPGQRPYTDFVDGEGGTAANQARRRQYLSACADLLTDNLAYLQTEWAQGGAYRATFLALGEEAALQNIYSGVLHTIQDRLPAELTTAVQGMSQENEQSAFSDYTHRDYLLAVKGFVNVYRGQYDGVVGSGIQMLVYQTSQEAYNDTIEALRLAEDSLEAIVFPFDYAIEGGPESDEGEKVVTAVENLQALATQLIAAANQTGLPIQ